jgi:Uma2 family endonuclease
MASVLIESGGAVTVGEGVRIPADIASLADFRAWALSDEFPEAGRIDYIRGCIEVDLSSREFFTHATVKTELLCRLMDRVQRHDWGYVAGSRTQVSSIEGDFSAQPDVIFLSYESLDSGRVRLVPDPSGPPDSCIEIEGALDLIIEIVGDCSVAKDVRRLPPAYFAAGVREYWLVDARGEELVFIILHRGEAAFEPTPLDADGFQLSGVMRCHYRLERPRDEHGRWLYRLVEREHEE